VSTPRVSVADTPRIGERVTLPTGLSVLVTAAADPARPWQAMRAGPHWQVCRQRSQGDSAVSAFFGGRRGALQLDEEDARALAEALNRVEPAMRRRD
jgi:hypothetical protein